MSDANPFAEVASQPIDGSAVVVAADGKDVKSGAPDGGAAGSGGSGGSGSGSSAKVDRSKVTDVWRRQTEWRASQGVLSHKVTVAVDVQNKKNWVYKCTFKPLPLLKTKDGQAVAATGKEKELPEVTVFRRFDDLLWLRSTVMKMFPGIWFCNLFGKGVFTSVDEKFLTERRDDAERLLTQLMTVGGAYNGAQQMPGLVSTSDPIAQFMSVASVDGFDKVRKEVETRLKNRASWIDDCLKSYNVHFPQYMATPVPDRADEQIEAWIKFLKEEESKMEKCIEIATALEATHTQLVATGTKMALAIETVAKHEEATKTRATPARLETQSKLVPWIDSMKAANTTGFGPHLTVTFKRELTDLKAFLEVLNTRQDLAKASVSAKKTAAPWKLPPAKPLTDKQRIQKDVDLKAEIDTQNICDAVTKLLLAQQQKIFWHEKMTLFARAMSALAASQIKALEPVQPVWKKFADEASVETGLL